MNSRPDQPPHVRVELLSQPRYLCGAREMVIAIMTRFGFSDLASSQVALAVDEALANVICHGYRRRPDGKIWLSIWPIEHDDGTDGPEGVRIIIEDEAEQVDPSRIQGRDLEDIRPGGLGVHIIREVMDVVEYRKRDERGMRLTLVKRLRDRNSSASDPDPSEDPNS